MTRVRLPPDPENSCVTTIIDSQGGDAALISAVAAQSLRSGSSETSLQALMERAESSSLSQQQPTDPTAQQLVDSTVSSATMGEGASGLDHVDSIVLVYDLDRVETFFRLERHWLPLIQRCYNGKVRSALLL